MRGRSFLLGVTLVAAAVALAAEQQRPLAPTPPEGQRVVPFFDGFYENADGSVLLSFGYSNLNATVVIGIPVGIVMATIMMVFGVLYLRFIAAREFREAP